MRTEIKQVTVEQEVYIADDGTEFDDESSCEDYEYRLAGKRLDMMDVDLQSCEYVENCWYVRLTTQDEIDAFIKLCKYAGIASKGIDEPGVYMYTEGTYGRHNVCWVNISKIVKSIEEREDNVSGN